MMLDVKSFQLQSFLPLPYEEVLAPRLKRAHEKLQSGSGAGGEFTGSICPGTMTGRSSPASRRPRPGSGPTPRPWWSSGSAART